MKLLAFSLIIILILLLILTKPIVKKISSWWYSQKLDEIDKKFKEKIK